MQYPSGQYIEGINMGRLLNDTDEKYLVVGNGAAELINTLGRFLKGKMYVSKSVFNEYQRCFDNCKLNIYDMKDNNYRFDLEDIKKNVSKNNIICIVNPDNPTGSFIKYKDMIELLDLCKKKKTLVIFDESFIDFANSKDRYTLINNEILDKYNNLIVIKSISKSYGIPGVRLGVLATSNEEIMNNIKKYISIWNINSFAEYYLQICTLYKKDYIRACDKIVEARDIFIKDLRKIKGIKVYNSEANYILCDLGKYNSTDLAIKLLENDNIFIKDLRTKNAFKDMNYIRLAVRTIEENKKLIEKLMKYLKK